MSGPRLRGIGAGLTLTALAWSLSLPLGAQPPASPAVVARIGAYVERYYSRAQSLMTEETVTLQPLARDLTSDGFARRLTYEVRIEWDPLSGEPATVVRQLLRVNGRVPRARDEPMCGDLQTLSPEPLAALLPGRHADHTFTPAGAGTVAGRRTVMVDLVPRVREAPTVEWEEECGHIDLPGHVRSRVWADPETGEVLRFDEQLTGSVEIPVPREQQRGGGAPFMVIERADMSIRYAPVTFRNPDEVLMLPSRIETVVVIRNSGTPRKRITQSFANYRRFVTESRIVQ